MEALLVNVKTYSWGTLRTVRNGSEYSIVLHPHHEEALRNGGDILTETGDRWLISRDGILVVFTQGNRCVAISEGELKL